MEFDLDIEVTKESLLDKLKEAGKEGVLFEDFGGFDMVNKRELLGQLVKEGLARFERDDNTFSYRFFTTDGELYSPQCDSNLKYKFRPRYLYGDTSLLPMANPFEFVRHSGPKYYIGKYVVSYFPKSDKMDHSYTLERKQLYCFVGHNGVFFYDDATIDSNIVELNTEPLHEATYERVKAKIEEQLPVDLYSGDVSSCFVGCRGTNSRNWFYAPTNRTWKKGDAINYSGRVFVFNATSDNQWIGMILERSGASKNSQWYIKTGASLWFNKGSIYYRVIEPIGLQEDDLDELERREFAVSELTGVIQAFTNDINAYGPQMVQMSFGVGNLKSVMLGNPSGELYPGTDSLVEGLMQ